MFAHPATHHFGRTYTGANPSVFPTTSRKNVNKENAGAGLPSKTPSRATIKQGAKVPSTSIRTGLGVKSMVKDSNVQRDQVGKGKGKDEDIEPKRLFASTSTKPGLPPSKSFSSFPTINTTRTHKTPGPSKTLRTTAPAPPTPLPSASRTRRRSRQSLTPLKQAAPIEFKTPAPSGKWEEEISLGSVEGLNELDEVVEEQEMEGDEELEYMPPPLPEVPFDPGWDLPDLNHAFTVLSQVPPMWTIHRDPVEPKFDFSIEDEEVVGFNLCDDDMLEEPMFRQPKLVQPLPKPALTRPIPQRPLVGQSRNSARPVTRPPVPSIKVSDTSKAPPLRTAKLIPPTTAARPPVPKTMFLSKPTSHPPPPPARVLPRPIRVNPKAGPATTMAPKPSPTQEPIVHFDVPTLDIVEVPLDEEPEFSLDL